jgi:uncharacterized protein
MGRPKRLRRIHFNPEITYFKPAGVVLRDLKENVLLKEELEAIRLIDFENALQNKVSKKMKVSQPTLSRLLSSARKKIADALINGKAIKIEGGNFEMAVSGRGAGLGQGRGLGRQFDGGIAGGRGRMGGVAAGPGGVCKCPKCGYEEPQVRGNPCTSKKCPKCGTNMVRK